MPNTPLCVQEIAATRLVAEQVLRLLSERRKAQGGDGVLGGREAADTEAAARGGVGIRYLSDDYDDED